MLRKKIDLIREIVKDVEMPQYEVHAVLNSLDKALKSFLMSGDDVNFGTIGKFKVKVHKECKKRNGMTGKWFPIPPTRRVRFSIFGPVKKAVSSNRGGINAEGQVS